MRDASRLQEGPFVCHAAAANSPLGPGPLGWQAYMCPLRSKTLRIALPCLALAVSASVFLDSFPRPVTVASDHHRIIGSFFFGAGIQERAPIQNRNVCSFWYILSALHSARPTSVTPYCSVSAPRAVVRLLQTLRLGFVLSNHASQFQTRCPLIPTQE